MRDILYNLSLIFVFIVMIIRPLANLFPRSVILRPLILLRKGFGTLSAAIIIAFVLAKVLEIGASYLLNYTEEEFWRFDNFSFYGHLGDVTGLILLVTSNDYARRVMGNWWKRIQKLAYVYFYSGTYFVYAAFVKDWALYLMIVATVLIVAAFIKNHWPKKKELASSGLTGVSSGLLL
ncbi:hypothetical protein JKY72_06850 [Candidatus Gracilibacteria bacterium]|nr:hypothetical protein [Candidatus Gracilibacteria bacterium]